MVHIYEFKREKRIEEITELLKEMMIKGEMINKKEVIAAIMSRYNISHRTASEYFMVAKYKNAHT